MKGIYLLLAVLMACGLCYGGGILTVGPGKAYSTIQDAIDAASGGDIVDVYAGTYTENIDFLGKGITVKKANGERSVTIDGGQNGPVVQFITDEENDSILDGFIIENGTGKYWNDLGIKSRNIGGGIYAYMSYPIIQNCTVRDNFLRDQWTGYPPIYTSYGGGIYMGSRAPLGYSTGHSYISPIIRNCKIYDNTTGGLYAGVRVDNIKDLTFENNTIYNNTYSYDGGGLAFNGLAFYMVQGGTAGTTDFKCNVIYDNNAWEEDWDEDYVPSAVDFSCFHADFEDTVLNIENNIITDNQGLSCLTVWDFENTYITNNTFADYATDHGGHALRLAGEESPSADYSNFYVYNNICWIDDQVVDDIVWCRWRAKVYISYCNIEGGTGNIYDGTTGSGFVSTSYIYTGNPDFDDPGPTGYDYHIGTSSASLDTASSAYAPDEDFEGDDRPYNSVDDIGADEYTG